jgi:NAD(P)-dependent dehydrogenase (short-subunit alcohol dehydrogenase family)
MELTQALAADGNQVYVVTSKPDKLAHIPGLYFIESDFFEDNWGTDLPTSLDGLVYLPGTINLKPFRALKSADFLHDFEVNVLGAIKVLQAALKALKAGDSSSVVLFSTVAVAQGMPFHSSIAASKGAIEGLMRSLAAELAPAIRVNAIAPSLTATPLASKLLSTPEKMEASAKRHPLQRLGKPEDVAAMAAFLLGKQSSWITGQVFAVDGGLSQLKV